MTPIPVGHLKVGGWHREVKNVYFMRFLTGKSGFDETVVGKQFLSNVVGIDNNYLKCCMVASGVSIDTYVSVAKLLPYSERQRFISILTLSIHSPSCECKSRVGMLCSFPRLYAIGK